MTNQPVMDGALPRRAAGLALAAALLTILQPATALGWGATGHRVVGEIASHHLSSAAARQVAVILEGESLAQAATWPDDIRSDPAWKPADPWHYLSIDDGETLETTARAPEGDVLEALHRFEGVLRDPAAGRIDKAQALAFLTHLVGDVHQPLHVGRRDDLGGNTVNVTWFGQPRNLHSVWDSGILEHTELSFSELARFLDDPTPAQVAAWQASTYEDWVRESFGLRGAVYELGDGKLSWTYLFARLPVVERRLEQAGVRLAGQLNRIFAPPPGPGPLATSAERALPTVLAGVGEGGGGLVDAAGPAEGVSEEAAGGASPETARAELMAADRAFAAATRERGIEGWMDALSADAVRLPRLGGDSVRGLAEIRQHDAGMYADPARELRWEPADAAAFDGGRLGYTTGPYTVVALGPDGEQVLGRGSYLTWWRREADGRWKVILDTGAPEPLESPAPQ